MANPNPKHKFTSTNQPAHKGKNHKTILLEALRIANTPMGEVEFVKHYIDTAMTAEPAQAASMLREIFLRINPIPKPVAPTFEFNFPSDGTPVEKINAVIAGVASGVVPVDIGKAMADIVKMGLDVHEVTELAVRLQALEEALEKMNA